MNVTFKPLEDWPKAVTEYRQRSRFESTWGQTLDLLKGELEKIGAGSVVIRADFREQDIRQDGWPRSNARTPASPGVVIEWQTSSGWSRMAADQYTHWQENVRAIAKSLEALRAVERWGAVEGQQYEGLRLELEAGDPYDTGMSGPTAHRLIEKYGGVAAALKATHPDHGGTVEEFNRVIEARRILGL